MCIIMYVCEHFYMCKSICECTYGSLQMCAYACVSAYIFLCICMHVCKSICAL